MSRSSNVSTWQKPLSQKWGQVLGSMSRYLTYLQNRNTVSKTIPQKYKIFAHFIACNMFGPQCTIGGQIKSNSRMVIKLDWIITGLHISLPATWQNARYTISSWEVWSYLQTALKPFGSCCLLDSGLCSHSPLLQWSWRWFCYFSPSACFHG